MGVCVCMYVCLSLDKCPLELPMSVLSLSFLFNHNYIHIASLNTNKSLWLSLTTPQCRPDIGRIGPLLVDTWTKA